MSSLSSSTPANGNWRKLHTLFPLLFLLAVYSIAMVTFNADQMPMTLITTSPTVKKKILSPRPMRVFEEEEQQISSSSSSNGLVNDKKVTCRDQNEIDQRRLEAETFLNEMLRALKKEDASGLEWLKKSNNTFMQAVQAGGFYSPVPRCGSEKSIPYSTAILIPYRDRAKNLDTFLAYMHPFLQRQNLQYKIYVVSQTFVEEFNRGALLNIAFESAMLEREWNCVVLHDIDLLPENVSLSYECGDHPSKAIHLNALPSNHQYKLVYESFFGGVSALTPAQFRLVNGFSNMYFGWGGEDDDLFNRLRKKKIGLIRPTGPLGRYWALGHGKSKPGPDRFKLLKKGVFRMPKDGLNSIWQTSKLISRVEEPLYTNYTVTLRREGKS